MATEDRSATGAEFWDGLPAEQAAELMANAVVRRFAAGQALLHERQVLDSVMVVRSGVVKVSATARGGREVVLAFRGPGELLGELAALDAGARSATIRAVDPVVAACLPSSGFRAFVARHPDVAMRLLAMLSRRLREADRRVAEGAASTAIERVAARLLEFSERFGAHDDAGICIALPLTQEEPAASAGASLESVARALHQLRELKCVETRRREIRILDRSALQALCRAA